MRARHSQTTCNAHLRGLVLPATRRSPWLAAGCFPQRLFGDRLMSANVSRETPGAGRAPYRVRPSRAPSLPETPAVVIAPRLSGTRRPCRSRHRLSRPRPGRILRATPGVPGLRQKSDRARYLRSPWLSWCRERAHLCQGPDMARRGRERRVGRSPPFPADSPGLLHVARAVLAAARLVCPDCAEGGETSAGDPPGRDVPDRPSGEVDSVRTPAPFAETGADDVDRHLIATPDATIVGEHRGTKCVAEASRVRLRWQGAARLLPVPSPLALAEGAAGSLHSCRGYALSHGRPARPDRPLDIARETNRSRSSNRMAPRRVQSRKEELQSLRT